ncbi:hypothetical protein I5M07_05180 [Flavobacterium sp. SE-1-e]|uniref:Uncharacterized protein n=1 Tax=Flavobacterium agrisoli TaxID=2793066 RepID=A0A934UJB1_9FLAO|nr:hypothetical protein [Flavobacterium agrisoli]
MKNSFTKGQLLDYFSQYLSESRLLNNNKNIYREIDFFQKKKFNNLSENAIKQLKGKIFELEILKTDNLSENVKNARIAYPRALSSLECARDENFDQSAVACGRFFWLIGKVKSYLIVSFYRKIKFRKSINSTTVPLLVL